MGTASSPIIIEGYGNDAALSASYDTTNADVRVFATNASSYITMKNLSIIDGNTTGSGSAIYYYGGELILEECIIKDNSTTKSSSVSGVSHDIYMYGNSHLVMLGTECNNGIYLYSSSATFGDDCLIGHDDNTLKAVIHMDNSSVTINASVMLFDSIYSDANNPIVVGTALTSHNNITGSQITISLSDYASTKQIVSVSPDGGAVLSTEVQKFILADSAYTLTSEGYLNSN